MGAVEAPTAGPAAFGAAGCDPDIDAAAAIVAAHPSEAVDPCDPSGWGFEAIDDLQSAVSRDKTLLGRIDADPRLAHLRDSPVYARWHDAAAADPSTTEAQRAFLVGHGWSSTDGEPSLLTLGSDGSYQLKRSGHDDAITGSWSVLSVGQVRLGDIDGRLGVTNVGAWVDAGDLGFFSPDPVLCDG